MSHDLYELTESRDPVSGHSEVVLRYTGTEPPQSIRVLRSHWVDLVLDEAIRYLHLQSAEVAAHSSFPDLKTLVDRIPSKE
jgi:hypothetical protein